MSTTLYVRLPQRPHDQPQPWQLGAMPFALVRTPVADKNRRAGEAAALDLLREGHASVGELPAADRLVLIVAASDVLLTTAMVPPLPPARLKLALPNLVEDVLASDAQPCHIALGPGLEPGAPARGARRRLLMVADRAWLRAVLDAFAEHKHRRRHVVPAQLCLPLTPLASPQVLRRYEPKLATEAAGAEPDPLAEPEDEADDTPTEAAAAGPDVAPVQLATLVVEAATAALAPSAELLENAPPTRIGNGRLWQITVRTGAYEGYAMVCCSATTRSPHGRPSLRPAAGMATAPRWPTRRFRRYTSDAIPGVPRVRSTTGGSGWKAPRIACASAISTSPSLNSRRAASTAGTCAHGACRWRWPAACCWYS